MVTTGDRLSSTEKDSIVRYILSSALEGNSVPVLQEFLGLGRKRVSDYIKHSQESSREKIEGAWTVFSRSNNDHTFTQQIGELIHGKKKARSFLEIIWGLNRDQAEEDDKADA
ncbi:hypothetical protein GB927_021870 [Shinella sp. CPCC 100929]|uniref:Uncharacterized protein n=1 Tax=Shinella lacus TaxID=2654216 RepID=A0ABT1RC20_9HYPH|nr:hypothetical protein [Shinella lacus]MCQ4632705.1 hypothetical protein [Shinella lacus]